MYTINISLPKQLYEIVEKSMKEEGYASRSEFFRTLIRIYTHLKNRSSDFEEFSPKSLADIKSKLKSEGSYSVAFIDSVITGLKKSSVYENKTPKNSKRRS